ncbi:alpha/beta fold hydrolase [Rhodococcus opacus]|uniref:alpha/beta fold hydrolase n=1 Tax=Rhodococcus opacus TaxID=37919 RepID=UPI001C45F9A6|nr:alpha/beta hydrolase [Rhodococcus opacus]MBV6756667.1 alpha/beta hydrolase [Rhodococcus opacus]
MPYALSNSIRLYYEESGSGTPIVFVHEYANDMRGWESQIRYLSRDYHCIAYNARGYPPSDVPDRDDQYGQDQAVDDIRAVLDSLHIDKAFLIGLSMGATAALHFAMQYPHRVHGLVFASGGSGSDPESRERFVEEANRAADVFMAEGMQPFVEVMSYGPTRVQLLKKDPRSWEEFRQHLSEHSPLGAALTMRNYQAKRPSLLAYEEKLRDTIVPTLVVAGDEDDPVLETSIYLKRTMPAAGLVILPKTGHAVQLEEPVAFNSAVQGFLAAVERNRWGMRDERAQAGRSAMLPDEYTATEDVDSRTLSSRS